MKYTFFGLFFLVIVDAQGQFTRQDTLRGTINPERAWWDVMRYEISVQPDYATKTIRGSNTIHFNTKEPGSKMQIDLQQPMQLDSAIVRGKQVSFTREGNAYHVDLGQRIEGEASITLWYSGKPREAVRPPWDGGWIWAKDKLGRPWMSVACQGIGASVWYPCKDHQSDEPDKGASLTMIVPDSLVAVANGRQLHSTSDGKGWTTTTWSVTNPINSYTIIPYIGKYVHWHEDFQGEKGKLDCDFWVLDYELEKAKAQFTQVPRMLTCFEHWFGPYPFYEDSYKLVQSPHLGMEHQSAVAYGNHFMNGYRGTDLSQTGWGLKWDFIIIHESGHEWFANNITSKDIADMWIHESFTNYSETLYTQCEFGKEAGNAYVIGTRKNIRNDKPIIGPYGVNEGGSGDMYYKGGNMLHIIRQLIGDDEKFREMLRGLNNTYWHTTVTTAEVESYMSKSAGINLSKIFDQYLRTSQVPVLQYQFTKNAWQVRWINCVDGFNMNVKQADGTWIRPTTAWTKVKGKRSKEDVLVIDPNFYIQVKRVD